MRLFRLNRKTPQNRYYWGKVEYRWAQYWQFYQYAARRGACRLLPFN
jgi:hypothetical protein